MKTALWLTLTLLAGCVSAPRIAPTCELADEPGNYLLSVQQGQTLTHLLLYSQNTQPAKLIALNPVGARLFEGVISGGAVQVVNAPHYRGPEPTIVLEAFGLWRMRDHKQSCWPDADVKSTADGGLELRRRHKLVALWSPAAPDTLTLPSAGMVVKFQEME